MILFEILGDLVVVSLQLLMVQEKKIQNEQLAAIGLATAEIVNSLKNLLVGIFGAVELLNVLIKQDEWQSVKENWNLLVESIKDISTVINKTLSYSKTDTVVKEEIMLDNLLREISDFIKPRCNISGIKLFYSCLFEKVILWANRESLYNAIMNILDNTLKVMTSGGELKICCDIESESKFARK